MMNTIAIEIRPWHEKIYAEMRQPMTLRATKRSLKRTVHDLETARMHGDIAAEQGVIVALRLVMIELATLDVGTARDYAEKRSLLREWAGLWTGSPLAGAVIEVGLQADAKRLNVSAQGAAGGV